MLDRLHAPGAEAAAVPDAIDLVDDRRRHVAWEQEVPVQRVRQPVVDRPRRRHQGLTDHLAPEDAFSSVIAGLTAKEVHLEPLEIELADQVCEGRIHRIIVVH